MRTEQEVRDLLKDCKEHMSQITFAKLFVGEPETKLQVVGLLAATGLLKWYLGEETIEHVKELLYEVYDNTDN